MEVLKCVFLNRRKHCKAFLSDSRVDSFKCQQESEKAIFPNGELIPNKQGLVTITM